MTVGPIRVVCIEDDPEMINLVTLILANKGFEIIGTDSGREGIAIVEQVLPQVVLLDLMMPDMDGWAVYQHLKSNPETAHIPVIVVTAKAQNIDKLLGLQIAKVDDYVTKPFGPSDLLDSVERVLQKAN
jgi:two-component system response regulator VicR